MNDFEMDILNNKQLNVAVQIIFNDIRRQDDELILVNIKLRELENITKLLELKNQSPWKKFIRRIKNG